MFRPVSAQPTWYMGFLARMEERFAHTWQMKDASLEAAIVRRRHVCDHLAVVGLIEVEVEEDARKDMEIAHMEIADVHSLEEQGSTRNDLVVLQEVNVQDLLANLGEGSGALVPIGILVVEGMDTQRRTSVEVDALEGEVIRS